MGEAKCQDNTSDSINNGTEVASTIGTSENISDIINNGIEVASTIETWLIVINCGVVPCFVYVRVSCINYEKHKKTYKTHSGQNTHSDGPKNA